jgi:hypothetical protein
VVQAAQLTAAPVGRVIAVPEGRRTMGPVGTHMTDPVGLVTAAPGGQHMPALEVAPAHSSACVRSSINSFGQIRSGPASLPYDLPPPANKNPTLKVVANRPSGQFGIMLSVSNPTAAREHGQMLDFDTEPYVALMQTREGIAALIEATREADAHADHVEGMDR